MCTKMLVLVDPTKISHIFPKSARGPKGQFMKAPTTLPVCPNDVGANTFHLVGERPINLRFEPKTGKWFVLGLNIDLGQGHLICNPAPVQHPWQISGK